MGARGLGAAGMLGFALGVPGCLRDNPEFGDDGEGSGSGTADETTGTAAGSGPDGGADDGAATGGGSGDSAADGGSESGDGPVSDSGSGETISGDGGGSTGTGDTGAGTTTALDSTGTGDGTTSSGGASTSGASTSGSTSAASTSSSTDTGADTSTTGGVSDKITVTVDQVLECGAGFVDDREHAVGEGYSETADDLRTGTCGPDACTTGGKTQFGLDLEFDLGLSGSDTIVIAELLVVGIPNNGELGTTWVYDWDTDTPIGSCDIDQPAQEYGACVATLDHTYLENGVTRIYTDNNDPACYFVYDYFELTVGYN